MSQGMNRVILMGNLGADPDLRYTQSAQPVLHMRLATTDTWYDKNKELQERTDWHNITVWGNRAEALSKFLTKGACVVVEGRLNTSSYEKDGVKHWRTEVVARDIHLTGRKPPVMPSDDDTLTAAEPSPAKSGGKNGSPKLQTELAEELPF